MSLSEQERLKLFGKSPLQYREDYSGSQGQLLYEGYASADTTEDTVGWLIFKHYFDAQGNDDRSIPYYWGSWTLRAIYFP